MIPEGYPSYVNDYLTNLMKFKHNILNNDPNELDQAINDCSLRVDQSPGQLLQGKDIL